MKIIFAGTPEFSVNPLKSLLKTGHDIVAVYTQPDKSSGRGLKINQSPIKKISLIHNLPIYQPSNFKEKQTIEILKKHKADLMVVVAYGIILPKEVLNIPLYGCLNIHASLLPLWRGAAPIQRAIENGDKETGITIMKMNEGLDTGNILYKKKVLIKKEYISEELHKILSSVGGDTIVEVIKNIKFYLDNAEKQKDELSTYAHKIKKQEAKIDWSKSADYLERKIKAFNSSPICFSNIDENYLRIWNAEKTKEVENNIKKEKIGEILNINKKGIDVKTGDGVLRILQIQPKGKKVMLSYDYAQSRKLLGKIFG